MFYETIDTYSENMLYSLSNIQKCLGESGDIGPETERILLEQDIDHSEFMEDVRT